jgi:hypothetical protein
VEYYGKYGHSDFPYDKKLADFMANEILKYIFGGVIECSVFTQTGTFEHHASGLLGTDNWEDIAGDIQGWSSSIWHRNNSYFLWQTWEDVLEYQPPTYEYSQRSRYVVSLSKLPDRLSSIEELRWLVPDDPYDFRIYVRTRAAPRGSLQLDWEVYRWGLLPEGMKRNHYEVKVIGGTSQAGVNGSAWASDIPRDIGVRISSWAENPYRWLKAEWKVFQEENRQRKIIDEFRVLQETVNAR